MLDDDACHHVLTLYLSAESRVDAIHCYLVLANRLLPIRPSLNTAGRIGRNLLLSARLRLQELFLRHGMVLWRMA
jgi:hypothetical protein